MFRINSLKLVSNNGIEFKYELENGINFYKGKNSSGKTIFYNFIDYMLGSSNKIENQREFEDTLDNAVLEFEYNGIKYETKRKLNPNICYFKYKEDCWGLPIDLEEYKSKLNTIFTLDESYLQELREFSEENITYRTFTLFSFFSERSSGRLNNFFERGQQIKYFVKLNSILNFIFNDNLIEISKLRKQLDELKKELNELEEYRTRFEFVKNNVNINLKKLKVNALYDGTNKDEILNIINDIKNMHESKRKDSSYERAISQLQAIYYNLDEQIKLYENRISDSKRIDAENRNREKIIKSFSSLLENRPEFEYLIKPVDKVITDLDRHIAFSSYIIKNNTISELKKQRDEVKKDILRNELKYSILDVSDKARCIAVIEEYIKDDINIDIGKIEQKKLRMKQLKEKIKELQNKDDKEKIRKLSDFITELYKSAQYVSSFVKSDCSEDGFVIEYIKKGNTLQPKILTKIEDKKDKDNKQAVSYKKVLVNYNVGSMARQMLIQLCGYLGFLKLLIEEGKYPLIPILVIDHISKPFDDENRRAIGEILKAFYSKINNGKLQIIIFDDEDNSDLNISPNHYEILKDEHKSGFNPFYIKEDN